MRVSCSVEKTTCTCRVVEPVAVQLLGLDRLRRRPGQEPNVEVGDLDGGPVRCAWIRRRPAARRSGRSRVTGPPPLVDPDPEAVRAQLVGDPEPQVERARLGGGDLDQVGDLGLVELAAQRGEQVDPAAADPLPPPPRAGPRCPGPTGRADRRSSPARRAAAATASATPTTASRRPAAASGDGSQTSTSRPSPVNRRPNRRTRSTLSVTSSQRYPPPRPRTGSRGRCPRRPPPAPSRSRASAGRPAPAGAARR